MNRSRLYTFPRSPYFYLMPKQSSCVRRNPFGTLLALAISVGLCHPTTGQAASPPTPSLKHAAQGLFEIGAGISDRIAEQPWDWRLLTNQFGFVTPENCMKPAAVQPSEGQFNFAVPDSFISFAGSNQLKVCGHCLVWAKDDRTPPWFFLDGVKPASRELLLRRMKTHIDTVMARYRGRVAQWDVVNEALDDGTNFLRPSGWTKIIGEDFVAKAFEYAHAADPDALLIYNDYNDELPGKREKLIRLVRLLREQHVPVQAVGLQGHYQINYIPFSDLETTLAELGGLGMKVVVSELDIDVIPRGQWWADGGKHREELSKLNPYRDGCPPEILQRQAELYAQLFQVFRKHADTLIRISFWNLNDGQSWLNSFPWKRVNYPLLFDRQASPKPAFGAVVKALETKPSP
jgi:endo-1,4-beta-xylanase